MTSKKTFMEMDSISDALAAMPFISGVLESEIEERKTKRLNLLLKPSLFEALRKCAKVQGTSVNALINTVLEGYTADHADDITRYNDFFGEEV